MRFSRAVVKSRVVILIVAVALTVPALMGMLATRINYDMLTYLPSDIDTMVGQDELMDQFGKGAFSFIVIEGMGDEDVEALRQKHGDASITLGCQENADIGVRRGKGREDK